MLPGTLMTEILETQRACVSKINKKTNICYWFFYLF